MTTLSEQQIMEKLDKDYLRNEIIIGSVLTAIGTAVGLGVGLWRNSNFKKTNATADPNATRNVVISTALGLLGGLVLGLLAALALRTYFQSQRARLLAEKLVATPGVKKATATVTTTGKAAAKPVAKK